MVYSLFHPFSAEVVFMSNGPASWHARIDTGVSAGVDFVDDLWRLYAAVTFGVVALASAGLVLWFPEEAGSTLEDFALLGFLENVDAGHCLLLCFSIICPRCPR